jgi:emfourin
MVPMHVSFRQSGGVPGFVKGVDLDTGTLDRTVARRLEQLVAESGIEGQETRCSKASRDLRQYEIVIRSEGVVASLTCDDGTVPKEARPLLRFLTERAGPVAP